MEGSLVRRAIVVIAATLAMVALVVVVTSGSSQQSSADNHSTADITSMESLSATVDLWSWPWQKKPAFAADAFLSPAYQAQTATEKQDQLWTQITADTTSSSYSGAKTAAIFFEDLSESFTYVADTLPPSHVKSIHSVGTVAKINWVSTDDHPYTGAFTGSTTALVRISSAIAPAQPKPAAWFSSASPGNIAPGMGVKFLADGNPSTNFVAMYSVDGQSEMNVFAHNFSNHIPEATTTAPELLSRKFAAKQGGTYGYIGEVGLKAIATPANETSNDLVVYPYSLTFVAPTELSGMYSADSKVYFTDQLAAIPNGTVLFDVLAKASPTAEFVKIASMVTASEMTKSAFGDDHLFFQHLYDLPDNQEACASDLPDCENWLKDTDKWTRGTEPFGPPPPPVPTRRSASGGCPFMAQTIEDQAKEIESLKAQLRR